jgi:hypothetical protein
VRDVLADDMFITTRAPVPASVPTPLRLDRKIVE